jgi:hypothetical protein
VKITSAAFSVGGVTSKELQEQSNQRAKVITEAWTYVKDQWLIDMIPEKYTDWMGYIKFTTAIYKLSNTDTWPALLTWCTNEFQEKNIPYRLDMSFDLEEMDGLREDTYCSVVWLLNQKTPIFFSTLFSFDTVKLLRNAGLLANDETIDLVDVQKAREYASTFRSYCVNLRANAANNLELDRFLGG